MQKISEGVSIILCCYNGAPRLVQTLAFLNAQVIDEINCEVLLIDNASNDGTSEIAKNIWAQFNNNKIHFRIICEDQPGLSHARFRGVKESSFNILIFCDDDNWLDSSYVQNVVGLFKANLKTGIIGGAGSATFDRATRIPPVWFDDFCESFAVSLSPGEQRNVNQVAGAGMAIRKSIFTEITEKNNFFLDDRKTNKLSAGGDSEICLRARLANYDVLYSPKITFQHFLPTERVNWRYLKKLHIGFANSFVIIDLYEKALSTNDQKLSKLYWLKKSGYYLGIYLKYWIKHYLKYKNGEGSVEELHHITWKAIAINYWRYNFKTVSIYNDIISMKTRSRKATKIEV